MTNTKSRRTHWLHSFRIFVAHFFHICFVLRGVLGVLLVLVLSGGLAVSLCEGFSAWEGIYFAIITSTSVGFGDITPDTVIGQCISVALALIGTIFFGLVVGAATHAVTVASRDYQGARTVSSQDGSDSP
jgi:voltage-gated potassium channel